MELLGMPSAATAPQEPSSPRQPNQGRSATNKNDRQQQEFRIPIKRTANARERTRTASVNDAFVILRHLIPTQPLNRKLSKIETLRLATSYISHLNAILATGVPAPEQPCLRHADALNGQRRQLVCTFCVNEYKEQQQQLQQQQQIQYQRQV